MAALNRAGLAQVGPGNTYVGLTRGGPGIPPEQPEQFRPSGRRNFVRLAAPDDLQGRAHAGLARDRGERSAYVLHDGVDAYSLGAGERLPRRGARGRGSTSSASRPGIRRRRATTRWPAGSRAAARTGVFLGGYILSNAGPLIRALRDALPTGATLMATEAMFPIPVAARAGGRGRRGPAPDALVRRQRAPGGCGRGLPRAASARDRVRTRAATRSMSPRRPTRCSTPSPRPTGRALGDAGTAATRVRDGLIGDFSFDENGDVTPPTVSVYRIENGKQELLHVVQDA